jgi:hypothetical protein
MIEVKLSASLHAIHYEGNAVEDHEHFAQIVTSQ